MYFYMITDFLQNLPAPMSWRTLFIADSAVLPDVAQHVSVRLSKTTIPPLFHHHVLSMRDRVWSQIPHHVRNSYQKDTFFAVLSKAPLRQEGGVWHRNLPKGNIFEGALRAIYYISTQAGSSIQFAERRSNDNNDNGVPRRQNMLCEFEKITVPGTTVYFEDAKCYHRVASNGTRHMPLDQRIFLSFTFLPRVKQSVLEKRSLRGSRSLRRSRSLRGRKHTKQNDKIGRRTISKTR